MTGTGSGAAALAVSDPTANVGTETGQQKQMGARYGAEEVAEVMRGHQRRRPSPRICNDAPQGVRAQ